MSDVLEYPVGIVDPPKEMPMPDQKRPTSVVVYVTDERRAKLRAVASRRYASEVGYASVSRLINEMLDNHLAEYDKPKPETRRR